MINVIDMDFIIMMTSEFLGSEFVSETDKTVINKGHAHSEEFSAGGGWVVRLKDPSGILRGPVLTSLFPCSAKLVIRWVDITQLEKNATLLLPDVIKVSTRSGEHFFSVFLSISETFKLMEQLANIAMRQLLDNEGFEQDRSLPKLKRKSPKKVSALKR